MQALKFRAWDKKRKRYAERIMTTNTSCPYHDRMNMFKGVMTFAKWILHRYIIEQYTGLKDQNDKEICEGDIVRYVGEGENVCLAVIKRKDEDKEQSYWLTGFVYEPFAIIDEEELTEEEYESLGGMEIIGNINENPELLGGKE